MSTKHADADDGDDYYQDNNNMYHLDEEEDEDHNSLLETQEMRERQHIIGEDDVVGQYFEEVEKAQVNSAFWSFIVVFAAIVIICFAYNQLAYTVTGAIQFRSAGVTSVWRWTALALSFLAHLMGLLVGVVGVLSVVTRNRNGRHTLAAQYLAGLLLYGLAYMATFIFSFSLYTRKDFVVYDPNFEETSDTQFIMVKIIIVVLTVLFALVSLVVCIGFAVLHYGAVKREKIAAQAVPLSHAAL